MTVRFARTTALVEYIASAANGAILIVLFISALYLIVISFAQIFFFLKLGFWFGSLCSFRQGISGKQDCYVFQSDWKGIDLILNYTANEVNMIFVVLIWMLLLIAIMAGVEFLKNRVISALSSR
jgi:hypothetical protein